MFNQSLTGWGLKGESFQEFFGFGRRSDSPFLRAVDMDSNFFIDDQSALGENFFEI